jgi:hypothetical protein
VTSYICRSCGSEYPEQPEDNFCRVCHENEVFPSDEYSYYDWED